MGKPLARSVVGAVLLGCLGRTVFALDPAKTITQYSLTVWRDDEGLVQNTIQGLAQTPDGYLWLATLEGLTRFDGVRFKTFDRASTPEISRNDIQSIALSRDGGLWIAIYGGGVVHYRDGGFSAFDVAQGLPSHSVTDLAEDHDGTLWIGTSTGLQRFKNGAFASFTTQQGLVHDQVRRVYVDRAGSPWLATGRGLDRYEAGRFVHYTSRDGLPSDSIFALAEDAQGHLWVGTDRGLARREGERFVAHPEAALSGETVSAIHADRDGSLWLGTGQRLRRLRGSVLETLSAGEGLPRGEVAAILEDREGNLWVATTNGLARLRDGPAVTYSTLQGLASDEILTVAPAAGGGLWVGSEDGRIDRLQDGRVKPLPSRELGGSRVLALLEDPGGSLWAGTDRGLYRHQRGGWQPQAVPGGPAFESVRSILLDRHGAMWVGTDGGGLLQLGRGKPVALTTREGLPSNQVRGLLEGRDGTLWIATYGGLAAYKDGRFASYTPAMGLSHDLVRSLYEDADGVLWAGTYGGGLNRLANGRIRAVTSREGLYSDVIYAIVEDGAGRLWMSSNRGIFSVSKRELADFAEGRSLAVTSVVYGRGDGMRSAECNGGSPAAWTGPDGRLWFATRGGVVAIDPAAAARALPAPTPRIEEVLVDGQAVAGSPLVLSPDVRRVEFGFTGLSFAAPERLRFAFRLEGFDPDWIEAGARRSSHYTGLAPGEYRFRVRATSGDAAWAEAPALPLRVLARWYRTRNFYALLAVGSLLGIWGAQQWRVRGLQARERELKQRVAEGVDSLKRLQGMLPICSSCKKIRDDQGSWTQLEWYIRDHSGAEFTHGICPECAEKLYPGRLKPPAPPN